MGTDRSYFSDITQGSNTTLAPVESQGSKVQARVFSLDYNVHTSDVARPAGMCKRHPLNVTYLMMALSSCLNNSEARPNLSQGTKRAAAGWKVTGGLGWILGLNLVLLGPVAFYYSLAK